MRVLSIKMSIRKKSGNLFNDPLILECLRKHEHIQYFSYKMRKGQKPCCKGFELTHVFHLIEVFFFQMKKISTGIRC